MRQLELNRYMKKYNYILWDMDDTLVDFGASERLALARCFAELGVVLSDEDIAFYSQNNKNYWKMLEAGKIEKAVMLNLRFKDFIEYLGLDGVDYMSVNGMYETIIGDNAVMFEGAYELCLKCKKSKKQYLVTNGTILAQHKKLASTGLGEIFDGVFISDEVGFDKPDIRFFQHVFGVAENIDPSETILIGDSLTGDMQGANNAGIDCCWYNPKGVVNGNSSLKINYEISDLKELFEILDI